MYWGAGSSLGLLTILGYAIFVIGAALVWRNRDDLSVWAHDEFGMFCRSISRYKAIGPFYGLREESRFKTLPSQFVGSLRRFPRQRVHPAFVLVFLGTILFVLDFFI
ncbi:MAG TPA: hypothetical protein VE077_17195 [Candidatus Methylomirabilis sp.]|nr:hypothetical protein [Candidatus Methylomirabilis sp.]